jgi:hypothetical protein
MVYLIGEEYDTTVTPKDTLLKAYDSTLTNAAGHYSFSTNNFFWSNTQRVKAALPATHASYANYLPTYHDSALMWRNARTFNGNAWYYHDTTLNISMRAGTNPGGAGFIGGRVVLGANKNVGDPLEGRILLLTTDLGDAVGYVYSDANGLFSFPNLATGNYLIFGDVWGKANPPLAITLSGSTPSVSNVVFEENSKSFDGHLAPVGVNGVSMLNAIRIYPNPAKDVLSIEGLSAIKGDKVATVRSITGAVVSKSTIAGKSASIQVGPLQSGMYMLQLQTAEGITSFKFIKD